MKRISYLCSLLLFGASIAFTSCDDNKTYAQKLDDEKDAIRKFVKEQGISAISVSEDQLNNYIKYAGDWSNEENHFKLNQWYKFEDGLYMKIDNYGDTTQMYVNMKNPDLLIRYDSCYNLLTFDNFQDTAPMGNNGWFLEGYRPGYPTQFGTGLVFPIRFLGKGGPAFKETPSVSLIVPSKLGLSADQQNVIPYFYKAVDYNYSFQ
ncbi:MAG: DUF4827 family protein [Bacteroidales bacterium]